MTQTDEIIAGYVDEYGRHDWTRPCVEMVRLRKMLDAAGIGWHERSVVARARNRSLWDTTSDMMVTVIEADGRASEIRAFTVMWGMFTYGGTSELLEVRTFDTEPVGGLDSVGAFDLCAEAIERARGTEEGERG